jgi:hypothetical protein
MFMRWRGFNIDSGLFNIKFNPPQNFASYRQSELDNTRITAFQGLEQLPYMSKRFLLERFLGLSQEEIVENEKLWREERDSPELQTTQGQDLRSIGITPAGLETDIQTGEEMTNLEPGGTEDSVPAQGAGGIGGATPGTPPSTPAVPGL